MRARDGRSARAHTTAESTDTSPDCTPWLIEGRSAARLTIGRAMPPAATIPAAAEVFRHRRRVNGWRIRMLMRSSEAAGEFLASRNRHQVHESLMTNGPFTSPRKRGERLSFLSSGLPWPIVRDDSVEDDEQLSGDSDERHQFGFAGCDQAVEEGFQDWVVLFRHHRPHEDGSTNGCPSAADAAFAPPFAGLARERSKPDEGGNLLVAELPELGQLGHKRACDDGSDARHGSEQFFLCAPSWRAFHGIVDICIEACQLFFQPFDEAGTALPGTRCGPALLAPAFGSDHCDDLAPPPNKTRPQPGLPPPPPARPQAAPLPHIPPH